MKSLLTTVCLIWLSCLSALGQNVELAGIPLSKSEVFLTWSIPAGKTYTSFRIDRQTTGSWLIINTVQGTVKSYTDAGLTEKTKYKYRLFCKGTGSTPDYTTNEVEVTTLPAVLAAPEIKSVDPIWDGNNEQISGIKVKWDTKSSEHTGFVIECLINGVSQGQNDLGYSKDLTEYTIRKTPTQTWPGCGTKMEVKLKAVIDGGGFVASMSSLVAVSSKSATVRVPDVPQNVKAVYMSDKLTSATWIRVSWEGANKPESVENGLVVQHATKSDFSDAKDLPQAMNTESIDFKGGLSSTGLANSTTYYFRVAAKNCSTTKSDWSNTASETTPAGPPPPAPTPPVLSPNFSQKATKNSDRITEITAKWEDKSNNETGFEIQWGDDEQYNSGSSPIGANVTEYKIDGSWPGCGHKVYVRVRAKNAGGDSDWSKQIVTTNIDIPKVPDGLDAKAQSSSSIKLTWKGANEATSTESGFIIQYSTNILLTSPTEVKIDPNTDNKIIDGLNPNTTYYFRIKAVNCRDDLLGTWSLPANATTLNGPVVVPVPADLLAVTTSETSIELSWTYKTLPGIAVIFEVHRSEDGSNFTPLPIGTSSSISDASGKVSGKRSDTGLKPGTTYYYKVRAQGSSESGFSTVVKATTSPAPIPKPAAPTNLVAAAASSSQINLSWTDASTDEEGFDIERSTDNANWGNLVSVGANVVASGATGLNANTKYYFRVRAKNKGVTSDWSNVAEATTQNPPVTITRPSAPTNLVATATSNSQINLTWTDASSNEDGFDLERSTDNVTWGNVVNVGINTTTYSTTGLTANTKYYFRVRAKNSTDVSDWSNVAEATTQATPIAKPNPPTSLTATTASTSQINLGWTDASTDEESFEIERSTDNVTWGNSISVGANAVLFSATSLTANTRYYFRVRSRKSSVVSDWSNVAEATTQALVAAKPATPTNLRLKATTANQISIEWDDRATDETGYEVSRSTDSTGKWEILKGDLAANSKEYVDKPVRSGRQYFYRVRAVRSSDFSDYSTVLETLAPIVNGVDDDPITWQVYPNPVVEMVQIQLNSSATCTAVIRNATGDELLKASLRSSGAIRVAELPTGVYFLQVTTSSQSKVFRILKQ